MSYMQNQGRPWGSRPYERSRDWRRPTSASGSNGARYGKERRQERSSVSSGYKRSLSPSPPASPSGTRDSESRRDSHFDIQPAKASVPASQQQPRKVVPGTVMDFPVRFPTGPDSTSYILRDQPWVNSYAPGHPVMVWDTYSRNGEDYARCLPMTSLNGKSAEGKYPEAWRHHLRYVPISQGGKITESRTNMPTLTLAGNGTMDQQTYVHLDHFFDIEVRYLRFRGRDASLQLDDDALSVLMFKFRQFVRGEVWRPAPNEQIKSPLDWQRLRIPQLGRPSFGTDMKERARVGGELEAARHEKAGTQQWTGLEISGESPSKGAWEPVRATARPFRRTSGAAKPWKKNQRLSQH